MAHDTSVPPTSSGTEPADQRAIHPLVDFLHAEAAGGVFLLVAAAIAIVWANSPFKDSYAELWHTDLSITLGSRTLDLDLHGWVNDGLMAIFFLVVGLEIKRELVEGELREPRRAAMPAIAAAGGMIVPVVLYLAINHGGSGSRGWGIPMATDIAIAVGVLSLLGSRIAPSLKLFLLALAIVDDIGAIVVITLFYSNSIGLRSLVLSLGIVGLVILGRVLGIRNHLVYVVLGIALWLAVYDSGVHATIAGVVLGLLAPTRPARTPDLVDADELLDVSDAPAVNRTRVLARESVSTVEWLEYVLHPWSSFVILPLFALANAGIPLSSDSISDAASSSITWGVIIGLVVGKTVGITLFAWLAARLKIGLLPAGASWRAIIGVAALAGIGFTVSIFVAELAFDSPSHVDDAKIGILVASIIAAMLGVVILRTTSVRDSIADPSQDVNRSR